MNNLLQKLSIISVILLHITINLTGQNSIQRLKSDIEYLTSFELKGRVVGTEGGKKAADYIANQFELNKVSSYKPNSYFHHFYVYKDSAANNKLWINGRKIPNGCYCSPIAQNDSIYLKLVAYDKKYNAELNDCSVLLQPKSLGDGLTQAKDLNKRYGTTNFILALKPKGRTIRLYSNIRVPVKTSNYYVAKTYANNFNYLEDPGTGLYLEQRPAGKFGFNESSFSNFNAFVVSTKKLSTLNKNPESHNMVSISRTATITDSVKVQNVIGKIEGKYPNKPAIVIGAHYDHVAPLPWEYEQYSHIADSLLYMPGADDNASGTAAIIEIARLVAKSGIKPDRTIYFCLFDGEESGFFGSTTMAKEFKDSIGLMINFDMVGRNKNNLKINRKKVYAKAEGQNARALLASFDKQTKHNKNINIDRTIIKNSWKNASDHVPFKSRAEIMYMFTGNHKDYHTPFDTADKINYTKLDAFCNEFAEFLVEMKF